jgi:hypothetical protein
LIEEVCSQVPGDMNNETTTNSEIVSTSTEHMGEHEISTLSGGSSVFTTTLIVTGVLLVCAIGGGLILAKLVKRLRKRRETSEYCDVYPPSASYVPVHLYEEIGGGTSLVEIQPNTDVISTAVRQQDSLM